MPVRQIVRFTLLWCGALASIALAAYGFAEPGRDQSRAAIYALLLDAQAPCVMEGIPDRRYGIYDSNSLKASIFRHLPPEGVQRHQAKIGPAQETIDDYIHQNQSANSPLTATCKTQQPTVLPYIQVTHIGFNSRGTQALVAIEEEHCSYCGGSIDLHYLVKDHGQWRKHSTWTLVHFDLGR